MIKYRDEWIKDSKKKVKCLSFDLQQTASFAKANGCAYMKWLPKLGKIYRNLDHFDLPYLGSISLDFQKLTMFSLLFMSYNKYDGYWKATNREKKTNVGVLTTFFESIFFSRMDLKISS